MEDNMYNPKWKFKNEIIVLFWNKVASSFGHLFYKDLKDLEYTCTEKVLVGMLKKLYIIKRLRFFKILISSAQIEFRYSPLIYYWSEVYKQDIFH